MTRCRLGRRSSAATLVGFAIALIAPGTGIAQETPVPRLLVGGALGWSTFTGSRFSTVRGALGLDASVATRMSPRLQVATLAHLSRHPTEFGGHVGFIALSVEPRLVFPPWRSRPLTYVGARASVMYRLGNSSGPGWGAGAALGVLWRVPGPAFLETGVTFDFVSLPSAQSGRDTGQAIDAHVGIHVPVGSR